MSKTIDRFIFIFMIVSVLFALLSLMVTPVASRTLTPGYRESQPQPTITTQVVKCSVQCTYNPQFTMDPQPQ